MDFRPKQTHKQGLKFLFYGGENVGKSLQMLGFPGLAIVDTESKIDVYENNPKFNKNIEAVADTTEYYNVLDLMEKVKKGGKFKTFVIDSYTNLYDSMQVAMMELEESKAAAKAKRFNNDIDEAVDDAVVAMRGWGKVKLNNARLKNLRSDLSARGIVTIDIAHAKPVYDKDDKTKIADYVPELGKGSGHDYDVIIRCFSEGIRNPKWFFEVRKDTSHSLNVGSVVECVSIETVYDCFKKYLEGVDKLPEVKTEYGDAINNNKSDAKREEIVEETIQSLQDKISKLFGEIKRFGDESKKSAQEIIKKNNNDNHDPRGIQDIAVLKTIVDELQTLRNSIQ